MKPVLKLELIRPQNESAHILQLDQPLLHSNQGQSERRKLLKTQSFCLKMADFNADESRREQASKSTSTQWSYYAKRSVTENHPTASNHGISLTCWWTSWWRSTKTGLASGERISCVAWASTNKHIQSTTCEGHRFSTFHIDMTAN